MKNHYLAQRKATINAYIESEEATTRQFMADIMMLVLNDPEVMGKDVFGEKRIEKVVTAWMKRCNDFHPALEAREDVDLYRDRLDRALRRIFGKNLVPFSERYDRLADRWNGK